MLFTTAISWFLLLISPHKLTMQNSKSKQSSSFNVGINNKISV